MKYKFGTFAQRSFEILISLVNKQCFCLLAYLLFSKHIIIIKANLFSILNDYILTTKFNDNSYAIF